MKFVCATGDEAHIVGIIGLGIIEYMQSTNLVVENSGLIWSVAKRFIGRGTEADDLFQLGCLGFLKAIEGFDLQYGTQFSTYAVPKIAGEIRRFLRDDGAIKVGRSMREKGQMLWSIRERLCHQLGREPQLSEVAQESGFSVDV